MNRAMLSGKSAAMPASKAKSIPKAAPGNLRIGEPNDAFEREADRVADQVMAGRMANLNWSFSQMHIGDPLRHKCAGGESCECEECGQEKSLQRKAAGPAQASDVPPIVHEVLNSPGRPLDAETRAFMEPRFGHNFGAVRVHTDAKARESAASVNALAYTVGCDVAFSPGRYDPRSPAGRRLLAHELAHVVQQSSSTAPRNEVPYPTNRFHETSADTAANAVLAGQASAEMPDAPLSLQRQPDPANGSAVAPVASSLGLASLLPSLPTTTPCTPASSKMEAEARHTYVSLSYIPYALGMFGSQTAGLWRSYLDKTSSALPRPAQSFSGSGEIVAGFTKHHKSAEAEREIVDAAAVALSGTASSAMPAPGGTVIVPASSIIPATTLKSRLQDGKDPMGLDYDSPATTIPGNIAGGIGSGGPPGNTVSDPDTRDVDGSLRLDRDPTRTNLTITPLLTFKVHDTVDFCPGALGGLVARAETVSMSILEATEGRFGPIYAADVPFDVAYPGPGVAKTVSTSPLTPTPTPPPKTVSVFPRSGPAKTTGSLLRIRTGPGLKFPAIGELGKAGAPIRVITQVHGDLVNGNDVWDQIDRGYVSDYYVAF